MGTQEWTKEMLRSVEEMNQIAYNQVKKLSMSNKRISNIESVALVAQKNMQHISDVSAKMPVESLPARPHF